MNILEIPPGKWIKVEFIDGQRLEGRVVTYESSMNTESGLYELTIIPSEGRLANNYIVFNETEVAKIEVIN